MQVNVPVARLEAFKAPKFSRLESYTALTPYSQMEGSRALKLSELETFRAQHFSRFGKFMALKPYGQIGAF